MQNLIPSDDLETQNIPEWGGHNNRAFKGTDQSNQDQRSKFQYKRLEEFMCHVIGSIGCLLFFIAFVMPSNWVMTMLGFWNPN